MNNLLQLGDVQCTCGYLFATAAEREAVHFPIKCPICRAVTKRSAVIISTPEGDSKVFPSADLTTPLFRVLWEEACRLHRCSEYNNCVIIAQTSCEIMTEGFIFDFMKLTKEIRFIEFVNGLKLTYSITSNQTVRNLCAILTGDNFIQRQEFWSNLAKSAKLRNRIVHNGEDATSEEAQTAIDAVLGLMIYFRDYRIANRKKQDD